MVEADSGGGGGEGAGWGDGGGGGDGVDAGFVDLLGMVCRHGE